MDERNSRKSKRKHNRGTTRIDAYLQRERERVGGKAKPVTHEQLVKAGKLWLLNTQRCRVVAAEMSTAIGETPDVVGFTNTHSRLIECKTSRGDFRADAKKIHHRADMGIGRLRWYMTPKDLVRPDEVPEGWGLLEYRKSKHQKGYYIKEVKKAEIRQLNDTIRQREFNVLVSIAWRALEAQKLTNPLFAGEEDEHKHGPESSQRSGVS